MVKILSIILKSFKNKGILFFEKKIKKKILNTTREYRRQFRIKNLKFIKLRWDEECLLGVDIFWS